MGVFSLAFLYVNCSNLLRNFRGFGMKGYMSLPSESWKFSNSKYRTLFDPFQAFGKIHYLEPKFYQHDERMRVFK